MSRGDNNSVIYAGGLSYELTEGDIICVFSQYGEISEISLSRDKDTGKSRGFCFLKYEDSRSCELAVDNLHGATVSGRKIKVSYANNNNALNARKGVDVGPRDGRETVNAIENNILFSNRSGEAPKQRSRSPDEYRSRRHSSRDRDYSRDDRERERRQGRDHSGGELRSSHRDRHDGKQRSRHRENSREGRRSRERDHVRSRRRSRSQSREREHLRNGDRPRDSGRSSHRDRSRSREDRRHRSRDKHHSSEKHRPSEKHRDSRRDRDSGHRSDDKRDRHRHDH